MRGCGRQLARRRWPRRTGVPVPADHGGSHDLRRLIATLDQAAARRIAGTGSWPLDHVMPGLSRLADRGLLWIGLAAALWATGDRQARRAAWRGLGGMAAASTRAHLVGKRRTGRRRPSTDPARPT